MKHKELFILYFYIILVALIYIFLPSDILFLISSLLLLVLISFYVVFKKCITKKIIVCFLLIAISQILFFILIHKICRVETLIARCDDIKQANNLQNILLDNYFSTKLSKDGNIYEIFALCKKNEIDNIMIILSESDAINQNVGLELFDKGDFTTTNENKREKLINNIDNRLTTIINKFEGVENVSVSVSMPEQSMFAYSQQPITANIDLETKIRDINRQKKIEKSIKKLLVSTITGLTEENIKIKIKIIKF